MSKKPKKPSFVECRHGLDERDCSTCKHPEKRVPFDGAFGGMWGPPKRVVFFAKFESKCPGCGLPCYKTQKVAMYIYGDDEHKVVFHEGSCEPDIEHVKQRAWADRIPDVSGYKPT